MARRHQQQLAILAFGTWVLFVAGLIALVFLAAIRESESRFTQTVTALSERLQSRLIANALVLDGFAGLVAATERFDAELLRRYARAILPRHPHMFALEVAQTVPARELSAFEERQREHTPTFRVRSFRYDGDRGWAPVPAKPLYVPIVFMEPMRPDSQNVLGLDLDSVPFLAAALAQSHAQGGFAASAPFRLVEGNLGYVLFRPARGGASPDPPTVLLVVDAEKLLLPLTQDPLPDLTLRLYSGADGRATLVQRNAPEPTFPDRLLPELRAETRLDVAGQVFILQARKPLRWLELPRSGVLGVAAAATVALLLVFVVLRAQARLEEERLQNEARLAHMAMHDALTGVPNRILLLDRFEHAMRRARRDQGRFGILFIDLNGFKRINDEYGHPAGDLLLKTIAQRLSRALRAEDTVARYSGDEFVVLLEDATSPDEMERLVSKLRTVIAEPLVLEQGMIIPSASIGMAYFPDDGSDWETLVRVADRRMYEEKRRHAG